MSEEDDSIEVETLKIEINEENQEEIERIIEDDIIDKLFPNNRRNNIDGEDNLARFPVLLKDYDTYVNCMKISISIVGELIITTYRLHFVSIENNILHHPPDYYCLPLGLTAESESERKEENGKMWSCYKLQFKDSRIINFKFEYDADMETKLENVISHFVFPHDISYTFSLQYYENIKCKLDNLNSNFDLTLEFTRQGTLLDTVDSQSPYRITYLNRNYELCETYPSILVVPRNLSDEIIKKACVFRSRNRFPVLTWTHPTCQCGLFRSAQPQVGAIGTNRCIEDEMILKSIQDSCPQRKCIFIADCRNKISAIANRAPGGGYENKSNYNGAEIEFFGIANIHKLRDSYRKLTSICQNEETPIDFRMQLENSEWLDNVLSILKGSIKVASVIYCENRSVLVHCSDGWDRTSQICSLSELLLDPYYRTIDGFRILIEKDWISFGHQFQKRLYHAQRGCFTQQIDTTTPTNIPSSNKPNQFSPVFLLFLDAIYQLIELYPRHFEFNSMMLVFIADHLYSCRFGSFLCNSEKDYVEIKSKTLSIFSFIKNYEYIFVNPLYVNNNEVIIPSNLKLNENIKLWNDYFLRWNKCSCDFLNVNSGIIVPSFLNKDYYYIIQLLSMKLLNRCKESCTIEEIKKKLVDLYPTSYHYFITPKT